MAAAAVAQAPTATIVGRIQDAAGAPVKGAVITAREVDTGETRTATSGAGGDYAMAELAPGEYEVTVECPGFQRVHQSGLEIDVDQTQRLDYKLVAGPAGGTLEVKTEESMVNAEKAGEGDVVAEKEMEEAPLADRDFSALGLLSAGVSPSAQGGSGSNMAINGARADNTNFVVDGFNDQNPRGGGMQVKPPVDAMQVFKMQTTGYPAEYGRLAGGVMNMVLKSGANSPHGSAFEFVRNDAFDARNFFDPAKSPLRRHQFGGMLNGPVWIPRLYRGRDRTFFLFAWESHRQTGGNNRLSRVPSDLERQGDFSSTLDSAGKLILLKDPLASGNCNANSTAACFPGNRVPASRMSAVALKMVPYYPVANRPGQTNNFVSSVKDVDAWDSFVAKLDHKLTRVDHLSARYLLRKNANTNPFAGSDLGVSGNTTDQHNTLAGLTWTRALRPTLIHELRGGLTRTSNTIRSRWNGRDMAAEFGLRGVTTDPSLVGFPRITVRDLGDLGDPAATPNIWAVNNYQWADTLTWVRARHVVKVGADVMRNQFMQSSTANNSRGTFNFLGRWTNVPFADLLLGYLNDSSRALGKNPSYLFATSYSFFAQDDFRVLPNLTLNVGVREEIVKPPVEKYGAMAGFVPALGKLILAGDQAIPNLDALVAQAGLTSRVGLARDNGLPASLVYTDYVNFGPRVGFAWRPGAARTVVRGGYGIFYSTSEMDPIRQDLTGAFPLQISESYTRQTTNALNLTLADPFPAARAAAQGTKNINGYETHAVTPYLQTWDLAAEREILKLAVDVRYVGSKGTHLGRQYNVNQPVRDPALRGADGAFPRPFPDFQTINYYTFASNSIYNAAIVSVRSRVARSFFYRLNYTYGKSIDYASQIAGAGDGGYSGAIDPRNLRLERGRSDWDVGHAFSANARYEITASRHRLIRGWQISGTVRTHTGAPFTPKVSNVDLSLGESNRPDRIANGRLDARTPERWYDLAAFVPIPTGSYRTGNSGRNILDGPGQIVTNASLMKRFWIRENVWAQFRWEVFNVLNHANLNLPNQNVNAANGGTITQADAGRVMQLGLKIGF
jgi:hypothetical protein